MRLELGAAGTAVQFIGINSADAEADQANLVSRCAFPLFQDLSAVDAFARHGGSKDDFMIYDADGKLAAYLGMGSGLSTNLSTTEGYQNVEDAVLAAAK